MQSAKNYSLMVLNDLWGVYMTYETRFSEVKYIFEVFSAHWYSGHTTYCYLHHNINMFRDLCTNMYKAL